MITLNPARGQAPGLEGWLPGRVETWGLKRWDQSPIGAHSKPLSAKNRALEGDILSPWGERPGPKWIVTRAGVWSWDERNGDGSPEARYDTELRQQGLVRRKGEQRPGRLGSQQWHRALNGYNNGLRLKAHWNDQFVTPVRYGLAVAIKVISALEHRQSAEEGLLWDPRAVPFS